MDGRTESLLWQTLAGTWTEDGPIGAERLAAYLVKAGREAKTWTSWRSPDVAAEGALAAFATYVVTDPEVGRCSARGSGGPPHWCGPTSSGASSCSSTLPGVADVYQGTETLVTALVDPDNRGPVDAERPGRAPAPPGRRATERRAWPTRSSR